MNQSLRTIRRGVAVIAFTGLLASCDNGDGGSPTVYIDFRMNNYGDCGSMLIEIDLDQAGATLAHVDGGEPDCLPDIKLDDCAVSFAESNGGRSLEVSIDDCDIPAEERLFECGFKVLDVQRLREQTVASCSCADEPICRFNSPCLHGPTLCLAPEGSGCEHCFNHVDDDGNGQTDCDDAFCDADCGVGQTTITCPSSSTTSTTLN